MEQSLLLMLEERLKRAGSNGIYADYTMQDMKRDLPIADILCEAAGLMLDDAVNLAETNGDGGRWVSFEATRKTRGVELVCHCGRSHGETSAALVFRLDTLWGIAARLGGRVDWNEQDDSAVVQVWLPYRMDESDESPQAARYPEKTSGAGGKSCGGTNAEVEE